MGRKQILTKKPALLASLIALTLSSSVLAGTVTGVTLTQIPNWSTKKGFVAHPQGNSNKQPTTGYSCSYGSSQTLYGKVFKIAGNDADAMLEPDYIYFTIDAAKGARVTSITGETTCSEDVDGDGNLDSAFEYVGQCTGC